MRESINAINLILFNLLLYRTQYSHTRETQCAILTKELTKEGGSKDNIGQYSRDAWTLQTRKLLLTVPGAI